LRKNNLIKKPNQEDFLKLVEFASLNGYDEYDILKSDRREIYSSMLHKFFNDETKTIYCLQDEAGNISGLLLFEELGFDTNLFGAASFRLTDIIVSRKLKGKKLMECAHSLLQEFLKEMRAVKAKFIQCKLDVRKIYMAQLLEEYGFILASPDATFLINLESVAFDKGKKRTDVQVAFCTEQDVKTLYRISKETYRTTRFHNDPNISLEKASEMQGLWIKNCYYEKLADEIIVVKQGRVICGYVACVVLKDIPLPDNKKIGRIVLITTDKQFQGQGIGSVLIQGSFKWFKENGCGFVAVGTQLLNLPAVNFYQKNGFRLINSILSFHKWI
jgi:ribosomal protein S18 acetylase RimI-like enzyme